MNVALFFGSFNPTHRGHVEMGEEILSNCSIIDEVWYILSPQNPDKKNNLLLDDRHRYKILKKSLKGNSKLKCKMLEFLLPKPSYSYLTLKLLENMYPNNNFYLSIGTDSLNNIDNWEESEYVKSFPFIVFERNGEKVKENLDINIESIIYSNNPYSSTEVRKSLEKLDYKHLKNMMCEEAYNYLINKNIDFNNGLWQGKEEKIRKLKNWIYIKLNTLGWLIKWKISYTNMKALFR